MKPTSDGPCRTLLGNPSRTRQYNRRMVAALPLLILFTTFVLASCQAPRLVVSNFTSLQTSAVCKPTSACDLQLEGPQFQWKSTVQIAAGNLSISGGNPRLRTLVLCSGNGVSEVALLNVSGSTSTPTQLTLRHLHISGCTAQNLIHVQGNVVLRVEDCVFSDNNIEGQLLHMTVPPMKNGTYRLEMRDVVFRDNRAHNLLTIRSSTSFDVLNSFNATIGSHTDEAQFLGAYGAFTPPFTLPLDMPTQPRYNYTLLEEDLRILSDTLTSAQLTNVALTNNTATQPAPLLHAHGVLFHTTNLTISGNTAAHPAVNATVLVQNDSIAAGMSLVLLNASHASFTDLTIRDNYGIVSALWLEWALGLISFVNPVIVNNTAMNHIVRLHSWSMFDWSDINRYRRYQTIREMSWEMAGVGCAFRRGDIWLLGSARINNESNLIAAGQDVGLKLTFDCPERGCAPGYFDQKWLYSQKFAKTIEWNAFLRMTSFARSTAVYFTGGILSDNIVELGAVLYFTPYKRPWDTDPAGDHWMAIQFEGNKVENNVISTSVQAHHLAVVYLGGAKGVIRRNAFTNNTGSSTLAVMHMVVKVQDLTFHRNNNSDITWISQSGFQNSSHISFTENRAAQLHRLFYAEAGYEDIIIRDNVMYYDPTAGHQDLNFYGTFLQTHRNRMMPVRNFTIVNNTVTKSVVNFWWVDFLFNITDFMCTDNVGTCLDLTTPAISDRNQDGLCSDELYDVSNMTFKNNTAWNTHGAGLTMSVDERIRVRVRDCVFENNKAANGRLGGGLYVTDWDGKVGGIVVSNCTFKENRAMEGGAVWTYANLTVSDTTFTGNEAGLVHEVKEPGAGLTPDNYASEDTNVIARVASGGGGGGAIYCGGCVIINITSNAFEGNIAPSGGAILALPRPAVDPTGDVAISQPTAGISNNTFLLNNATGVNGHGHTAWDPETAFDATWEDCPLGGGGAVCLRTKANLTLANNTFERNGAVWGGALLMNTDFSQFTTLVTGLLYDVNGSNICRINMTNNAFVGNMVREGLGPVLFYNSTEGICLYCDHTAFLAKTPTPVNNDTKAWVRGCQAPQWQDNRGAASFAGATAETGPWVVANSRGLKQQQQQQGFGIASTRQNRVLRQQPDAAPNPQDTYGTNPDMNMATFPSRIQLEMITEFQPQSAEALAEVSDFLEVIGCPTEALWTFPIGSTSSQDNAGFTEGHELGSDPIASPAVVRSGGDFNISVRLYDRNGLPVPRALSNITLIINFNKSESLVVYNWQPMVPYNWTSLWAGVALQPARSSEAGQAVLNETFHLNVVPITSQQDMTTQVLDIVVRPCFVGEVMSDIYTCSRCQPGSFSLLPEVPCSPCPSNGWCEDAINVERTLGYMVPRDRYWKSSMFSPTLHRCPMAQACVYGRYTNGSKREGRASRLGVLQSIMYNQLVLKSGGCTNLLFMAAQCGEGYEGNFCGLCKAGYGRQNQSCAKCNSRLWNTFLILALLLIVGAILAILVFGHVRNVPPGLDVTHAKPVKNHKQVLVSMFKVILSFLQVLGILRTAQIDWPRVLGFLTSFDPTSSFFLVSPDCSNDKFDGPQTLAVKRSLFFSLLPVLYILLAGVVCFFFSLFRRRTKTTQNLAWVYFIITVQQICYLLYPITTTAILNIFTCWNLDQEDHGLNAVYADAWSRKYSNHGSIMRAGRFWTENLSQKCFQGGHLALVLAFGVPALGSFTIGVPVIVAFKLLKHRPHLYDTHTILKYGFLYEEYRHSFFFWEVVVLARKALLLLVTILLQPYGAAVQLHTAVVIQMIMILLHELAHPYKDSQLNGLERVSLYSNQFTLVGLTFLTFVTGASRTVITVLVFLLNISVMLFFSITLGLEIRAWIRSGQFRSLVVSVAKAVSSITSSIAIRNPNSLQPLPSQDLEETATCSNEEAADRDSEAGPCDDAEARPPTVKLEEEEGNLPSMSSGATDATP